MILNQPSATAQDSPGLSNHPTSRFIVYRRFWERLCPVGLGLAAAPASGHQLDQGGVKSDPLCLEQRCETSNRYVLRSKVVRECVFKFICSRLEPGNAICGSYGIDVLSQPPQSDGNLSMSSPNLSMSSPCHHGLLVTRKVTRISSLCRLAFSLSGEKHKKGGGRIHFRGGVLLCVV